MNVGCDDLVEDDFAAIGGDRPSLGRSCGSRAQKKVPIDCDKPQREYSEILTESAEYRNSS